MNWLCMYQKRFLKIVVLTLVAFFLPVTAVFSAPQFGLGISITEDGQVIHCPIKIDPHLRLEGSLGIRSYEIDGSRLNDEDSIILKFGGYYVQNVYEKTDIYYGGRLTYEKNDSYGSNRDGFGIAPVFGFEYYLTGHISVGGEAELYIMFGDIDQHGTDSRLILRYYF